MTLTQKLLDRITGLLNRDAINYTVFLRLYQPSIADCDDPKAFIREALGVSAEIGGAEEIGVVDLLAELDGLLRFAGDAGAGPSDLVLKSKELSDLLNKLNEGILGLTSEVNEIKRFWLKTGHPAYPVFWDFAYIFMKGKTATILIG